MNRAQPRCTLTCATSFALLSVGYLPVALLGVLAVQLEAALVMTPVDIGLAIAAYWATNAVAAPIVGHRADHRLRVHRHERRCVRRPGCVRGHRCITRLLGRLGGHRVPQPVRRCIPSGSPARHDRARPSDARADHYRCNP